MVGAYANAVGVHGPGSPETIAIREAHADNAEFLGYADALDRIKLNLRGKGMGDKVPAKECRVCLKAIDPDQMRAFFRIEKYGLHPKVYWVCSWKCLEEHAANA